MGCVAFDGAIPERLDEGLQGPGLPGRGVQRARRRRRVHGRASCAAGCATSRSTLLRYANACGALVVSRHGCAPAMPSWTELQHFSTHGSPTRAPARRRAARAPAPRHHAHAALAMSWRCWPSTTASSSKRSRARHGADADASAPSSSWSPPAARGYAAAGARRGAGAGVILDGASARTCCRRMTGSGWWIARPVELPGSRPLAFEAGDELCARAAQLARRACGQVPGDATTPTTSGAGAAQLATLRDLQRACHAHRPRVLLEVIPPRDMPRDAATLARALAQIYAAGVKPDWWKLPPRDATRRGSAIADVIERNDPHCRGVLLLGLEASEDDLDGAFAPPRRSRSAGLRGRSLDLRRRRGRLVRRRAGRRRVVADIAGALPAADRAVAARRAPAWPSTSTAILERSTRMTQQHRIHRPRHDGPRHGQEPAGQGLRADASRRNRNRAQPGGPAGRRREGVRRRTPSARAPATSCSSASPARRRSRRSCTATTACWPPRARACWSSTRSTAEPASTARIRADLARPRGVELHRRAAGAHAEGSRRRAPEHHGRRRAPRTSSAIEPVLKAFCENIFHVGPPGHGHVLKLVNNMMAHELRRVPSPKPSRSAPRRGWT